MQFITADDAMKEKLSEAKTLVAVRDVDGTVIGFFARHRGSTRPSTPRPPLRSIRWHTSDLPRKAHRVRRQRYWST
jgi:hypothetical protein